MGDDDWARKVAKLLLSEFDGRAKFGQLKRSLYQRNLVKGGIARLLKRLSNSDRFLVFKKGENMKYISIAWENVSICCGFRNKGWESCRKEGCSKFHVCKYFISGNCEKGSRCRFGHDLENKANKKVSDRLGLSSFSAEEIRTIISRSHPAVCLKYNTGGCDDDDCPDLHVCSRFMLQKCTSETDCKFIHSLQMFENNLWVLDTFKLSDLTDEELRKRTLVKNRTPRVTDDNIGPQSQMTPVPSSSLYSESTSLEEIKENIDDVFRYLFKHFGGRAKFDTFLTERGHLFQRFDREAIIKWLKNRRSRFVLYESGNDIKYVSVYDRGARACFKYYNPSSLDCGDQSCKYFHICRRFIAGACVSTRCIYSHSFSSGPNIKVCSDLKLDKFTEGEILNLILCSSPTVCVNHNLSGCYANDCPDLHVCFKYIFSQCTSGQGCKFGHSIGDSGEHNSYVLKAFQVDKWQEEVLRRLIIVKKGNHLETPEGAMALHSRPAPKGDEPHRKPARDVPRMSTPKVPEYQSEITDNISECIDLHSAQDDDPSKYEYICEIHTWTDFRKMLATIKREGKNRSVKLRRLSTPSYVDAAPGTPLHFYTQWVWYWQERDDTYTPFIPGTLQYTLEEKYLEEQYLYYLRIKKLRLLVETHSSSMTQTNLDSGRFTRILRRPVFMCTEKLDAPTMSPLLLTDVPKSIYEMPEHWASVDHFQEFETVLLDDDDPEYTEVERQFFSTMNAKNNSIVVILRVQNPRLWDKYCSVRRAMTPQGQGPEDVQERQLFHGTPTVQAARGICANSFDFRRSGENVGAVWGKGAYFSTTARYSHKFTSPNIVASGDPVRFMFLGRVLVGQYTLGHSSYRNPPERGELKLYDSCVDDISDPSIFVIFDLAQSYPEYWIQYIRLSDYEPVSTTSVKFKAAVSTTATSKPYYYGMSSSASRSDRYSLSSSASGKPNYYGLSSSAKKKSVRFSLPLSAAGKSQRDNSSSSAASRPEYHNLSSSEISKSDYCGLFSSATGISHPDKESSSPAGKSERDSSSSSSAGKSQRDNSPSSGASRPEYHNLPSSEIIKSDYCGPSSSTTGIYHPDKESSSSASKSERDSSSASATGKPDDYDLSSSESIKFSHSNSFSPATSNVSSSEVSKSNYCGLSTSTAGISHPYKASSSATSKPAYGDSSSSAAITPDCYDLLSQEISKLKNYELSSSAAGKVVHDDLSSPATSKPKYYGLSSSDYCPTSNSPSGKSFSADSQSRSQHQSPMPDPPPSRSYCLIS